MKTYLNSLEASSKRTYLSIITMMDILHAQYFQRRVQLGGKRSLRAAVVGEILV